MVYQAVVWTPYQKDLKKLEQFHQRKLRSILNMKWDDYTTNDSVLEQANAVSIESTGVKHRLCWSSHIAKMSDARLPWQLLCIGLTTGLRPRGRPLLRYKDQVKATFKKTEIDPRKWETTAANRSGWRRSISFGTAMSEAEWRCKAGVKREEQKRRLAAPRPPPTLPCPHCPRKFYARIGLLSHLQGHQRRGDRTVRRNWCLDASQRRRRRGLSSTLIRHENGAFRKRSSNRRNLKTRAVRFRVKGKHSENGAFRNR